MYFAHIQEKFATRHDILIDLNDIKDNEEEEDEEEEQHEHAEDERENDAQFGGKKKRKN